jgi:hypothetical protein
MKRGLAAALLAQLSLFDEAPSPVAPPAPARGAAPRAVAPDGFRHPQTAREVRLGEHVVGYALRRGRRRSIGFVVAPEGLSVAAPRCRRRRRGSCASSPSSVSARGAAKPRASTGATARRSRSSARPWSSCSTQASRVRYWTPAPRRCPASQH